MGILDFAEEAAGAFAADKALEAVDPDAGFLAKAAAAVAGFEGVSKLKQSFDQGDADSTDGEPQTSGEDETADEA